MSLTLFNLKWSGLRGRTEIVASHLVRPEIAIPRSELVLVIRF